MKKPSKQINKMVNKKDFFAKNKVQQIFLIHFKETILC